jgi:hypothetical protein
MKRTHFLLYAIAGLALQASAATLSHDGAKKLWEQSKERAGYDQYSDEFAQFNNSHHLDEKDGCYGLSPGPVTIYLVIKHNAGEKFAVIEQVVSDVDNAKAKCFKKTYTGVPAKAPPFLPLVLQMKMGG